jgi:hypothetical protein
MLIDKILTLSSIPLTCSQMSVLVGLPESSGERIRGFHHPISSSVITIVLSPHISTGGRTIGPSVAAVLRLSLSPSM